MAAKKKDDFAELDAALVNLRGKDPTTAKAAARKVNLRARANWTKADKEWLTRESTVAALLEPLPDASPDVAVEIIGALGALSQRYEFPHAPIRDGILAREADATDDVRIAIAQAVPHFGTNEAWQAVLAALDAKPPKAAHHAVGLAVARYGEPMPAALRPVFASALLGAAKSEKNRDSLTVLVKAVKRIGSRADVPGLRALVPSADSDSLRETIQMAIVDCEGRG